MNAGVVVFVALVVLAFLGLPIFLAIAVGTMLAMVVGGFPLETMAQNIFGPEFCILAVHSVFHTGGQFDGKRDYKKTD